MRSHLLQMRGLKQKRCATSTSAQESHLLQMRGLKLVTMYAKVNNIESHLLQMRGLKRLLLTIDARTLSRIFYRCVD